MTVRDGDGCHTGAGSYLPETPVRQAGAVPYGCEAAPRVRARGRARGSRWGCHTGAMKTAAGVATDTPQQACAVRMAGDTPSAVMPSRNARRRPYRRATTVMPGGSAGGPVVRPTARTQGVHRKVRCRYGVRMHAAAL